MDSLTPVIPDFGDPIGLLLACHSKMRAQCDTLEKLPLHLAANGVDDDASIAVRKIIIYFTTSAAHHHQDEEEDVFPALLYQSPQSADLIHELQRQHTELNRTWDALKCLLDKTQQSAEATQLNSRIEIFCHLYRNHLNYEEEKLFSLVPDILSRRQLDDIGNSMARRRGIKQS
ncbi:MAG: hemerythrin domain-containing protein [Gammaproteobacteria bacterium]